MHARVRIIGDDGMLSDVYYLSPSNIIEDDISTTYIFEFEHHVLNREGYKSESEDQNENSD